MTKLGQFSYKLTFTLLLFSAVFLSFSSCTPTKLKKQVVEIKTQDGKVRKINCELAITAQERQHGYMGRKRIKDGEGMLFIFSNDELLSFWMKDTPCPLSIAYIKNSGEICDIFDMTPFSLATIESTSYARYALEVPKGYFRKEGITEGDSLDLSFLKEE